ncbi:hypothetical protein G4B88_018516 [Cannabis sativa]|uniref:Uncharacterized protein n=1 Tax=Cannabis sativa TaxID=3483 RepID=A0A7J6HGD7_CANSA|nr:hypothetical protein G4B88_018516 [Cannabis sativa]
MGHLTLRLDILRRSPLFSKQVSSCFNSGHVAMTSPINVQSFDKVLRLEIESVLSIREAQSLPNPNTHTFFFRCPLRRLLPFLSPSKTLLTQNIAMATLAAAAARQAATLTRISTPRTPFQAANLVQKRDHHGPARVNVWEDPMSPSKWKEEHFVIVSLSGWGLLIFGGYKLFSGGKDKKEELFKFSESGGSNKLSSLSFDVQEFLIIMFCLDQVLGDNFLIGKSNFDS